MRHDYDVSTDSQLLPLNRPFIELFSRVMEAELSDNSEALTNLAWTAQVLGSMTLDAEAGKAVDDLNRLIHTVHSLINQHLAVEIDSMATRDDDLIQYHREYCKNAIASVERIISRYKLQIICYSFTAGPMAGCTVKNTNALAFDTKKEFENAVQFVIDELTTLGFDDVVVALVNGSSISATKESKKVTRTNVLGTVVQQGQKKFASSKYRGLTEKDKFQYLAGHPGILGEKMWESRVKQQEESKNANC